MIGMVKKAKKKREWVLQAAVFSALRRIFRTYPPYREVLDEAKEEYYVNSKKGTKMRRVRFACNHCGNKYARKGIAIDHITPVVDLSGLAKQPDGEVDFNVYIKRLFCPKSNLQSLCKKCHAVKSASEGKVRAKLRKPTTQKPKRKTK
jgi:5-methylcytosine-specific restriction endonuclease McrA